MRSAESLVISIGQTVGMLCGRPGCTNCRDNIAEAVNMVLAYRADVRRDILSSIKDKVRNDRIETETVHVLELAEMLDAIEKEE